MRRRALPVILTAALLGVPAGFALERTTAPPPPAAPAASASPSASVPHSPSPSAASPSAASPSAAGVDYAAAVSRAPRVAGQPLRAAVLDAQTGQTLAASGPEGAMPPASSLKVVSAAAILSVLDPAAVMTTSVVRGPAPGEIVLVGGGDSLLGAGASNPAAVSGRAGLKSLAAATASGLGVSGSSGAAPSALTLRVDDSLFTEQLNTAWPAGDIATGQMTRLSPLAVSSAALTGASGLKQADPALEAAAVFAAELKAAFAAQGQAVTVAVSRGKAPAAEAPLASVRSATVAEQLDYALDESDNYVVETLARVAALKAGHTADSAGVAALITSHLPALTAYPSEITAADACGLSLKNQITPRAMASVLQHMAASGSASPGPASPAVTASAGASPSSSSLRTVLRNLPVAGLNGTLAGRFSGEAAGARGLVRAKTGTLNATAVLAGYAVGPDGRLVVFTLAYTGIEGALPEARAALDRVAAEFVTS